MEIKSQPVYYVAFFSTSFHSIEEVKTKFPDAMAAHIARSREFQKSGTLLMAGAFRNQSGEPISTMGVLTSREAAEEYAKGDPFVLNGMVMKWEIREWNNILT